MKPIISRNDLPPFSDPESNELEWKQHVSDQTNEELAKDIAAMANSFGGTIIVGIRGIRALENEKIEPMTKDQAIKLGQRYQEAGRELLSPSHPGVNPIPIEIKNDGSDKWVLSVNIDRSTATFCGLKIKGNSNYFKKEEKWVIPRRVGTLTKCITIAEAQGLTIDKIREAAERALANILEVNEKIRRQSDELRRQSSINEFKEFMYNKNQRFITLRESNHKQTELDLTYLISPVHDIHDSPLLRQIGTRTQWLINVISPALATQMAPDELARYEDSPIREGETYYCEYYNDSWHIFQQSYSDAHAISLSSSLPIAQRVNSANSFVEDNLKDSRLDAMELFELHLDQDGKIKSTPGAVWRNLYVIKDLHGNVFLRINDSPPKSIYLMSKEFIPMYLVNKGYVEQRGNMAFRIENLRGYGSLDSRRKLASTIYEELIKRNIAIPIKKPFDQREFIAILNCSTGINIA